jgi:hypothetical protein
MNKYLKTTFTYDVFNHMIEVVLPEAVDSDCRHGIRPKCFFNVFFTVLFLGGDCADLLIAVHASATWNNSCVE